jgi:hypothetical protein
MADLTSKIKLLIQSQDGANQDAKLFPILPIPATVGDALTCSRALNTATRVNSAGLIETVAANMPRITWERGVDQCPNLLVEKSEVGNIRDAGDLTTGLWTVGADLTRSPLVVEGHTFANLTAIGTSSIGIGAGRLAGTTFGPVYNTTWVTFSWYFKKTGTNPYSAYYAVIGGNDLGAWFNVDTGESGIFYNAGVSARVRTITKIETDLYLVQESVLFSGNLQVQNFFVNLGQGPGAATMTIGATGAIGLPQVEAGMVATSRIISGATSLTRNADVISKTGIGTLLSGAKGLFADCYLQAGSLAGENVNRRVVSLSTGGGSNAIAIGRYEGIIRVIANNSGIDITDILITTPFKNKRIKVFVAFDIVANTLKMYVNGALVKSLTSFTAYTPSTVIDVGGFNGVNQWDGLIKAVAVTDEFTEADIEQISSYPSFENMAEQMMYDFVG